jgi:pimeloyl-ACP methyl ester carboxylesterase
MYCKSSDGAHQIYYEIRGNTGATQTLVFLNGLTQATFSWVFFMPYFEKDFRVILLDFIFQGKSDKDGAARDFDTHARDVYSVLAAEKISRCSLIGISYGSLVAQHFALLYPDVTDKLILLSTFAHKTPYYEAIELSWWRALETGGYNLMLDIMLPSVLSESYFANPIVPISKMKESRQELNRNSDAILKLMEATRNRPDYRKRLKNIIAPTLIIQGEKDLLLPVHLAEEVKKNIPGAKLLVVKNAGHTLNLEHVNEVCAAILSFLKEIK